MTFSNLQITQYRPCLIKAWFSVFLLLAALSGFAQNKPVDTSDKITINIIFAKRFVGVKTDSAGGSLTKLIDSVSLQQGGTLMYCDSTFINIATNNLEAFGDVRIIQPGGTQVSSDYLRYTGNTKLAYLKGNVKLTDGKNYLWSDSDLTYNLGTKIGIYEHGGTLQSETTTVSSVRGMYNVTTKDSRFTDQVFITDPQYNTVSDDLGYNTETKFVTFYAPSVVTNKNSELRTSGGTYDSKGDIAHFTTRSSIFNREHYIEADKIDYNGLTRLGNAFGKVVVLDTIQHTKMWCGFAAYNEKKRTMFSTIKPVLRQANGADSLYIRADTFFSAPLAPVKKLVRRDTGLRANDSLGMISKAAGKLPVTSVADSIAPVEIAVAKPKKVRKGKVFADTTGRNEPDADSTAPRYYIGYHNVYIFSDSLQGRCDSISYNQRDSVMKMMRNPIVWSRSSQVTGDTILMYNDSSKIKRIFVPNNALVVSQSGPEKAKLFDQVQGKTLTGYFVKNAMDRMIVFPNAESIYFQKDDNGAYLGVTEAKSERMRVFFKNQAIRQINLEQETEEKMTPLELANLSELKLSRFKWLIDQRPKSREQLFQ